MFISVTIFFCKPNAKYSFFYVFRGTYRCHYALSFSINCIHTVFIDNFLHFKRHFSAWLQYVNKFLLNLLTLKIIINYAKTI